MALWTDVIDPATLTGYARASLADYEERKGTLARWLPNREVSDIVVRFVQGQAGLTEVAKFRAYDAEPEIGKAFGGKRVTLELPALGQNIPISEYQQLRSRNAADEQVLVNIQRTTDLVVRAIADAIERLRGTVLETGRATINQDNFKSDDDFARPAGHTVTAATPWSTASVSRLADLTAWADTYRASTGEDPGALVMSNRVFRAFANGTEFATQLLNGGSRPATAGDIDAIIAGAGLPPIYRYDRTVNVGGVQTRVTSDDKVFLLPAPVDPNAGEASELGATFWGQTLTSSELAWGIEPSEQPGIVVGAWKNDKVPVGAEVISDAIALPVLANAALSFVADVL
jgi:hypothetical protein